MSYTEENAFDIAIRFAGLIKTREAELGAYVGDGPTAEQAEALVQKLLPLSRPLDSVSASVVWDAFRAATEAEAAWIFPENDTLTEPMRQALIEIQNLTGQTLEALGPEWKPQLEKLANLHVIVNAGQRQEKLRGNKISWRIAVARLLWSLGIKKPAISLADNEVRRWKR